VNEIRQTRPQSSGVTSKPDNALRITEIFYSLQGESRSVGLPTTFIRLTGCPLRCQYCDTSYAFTGGEWMSIEDVITRIKQYPAQWVTVTGGEPLAQKNCLPLLTQLCDADYYVSLETSGALSLSDVDQRVVKVMDLKTPGSGEAEKNLLENLGLLSTQDQVKFVICDEQDYEWSKNIINQFRITDRCEVLMSPSFGQLDAAKLAEWILRDGLTVRFQLQLHKILWGNEPGR